MNKALYRQIDDRGGSRGQRFSTSEKTKPQNPKLSSGEGHRLVQRP
jgi:hypothetical protein